MQGDSSCRLREFLKKVRNSSVDYDDYWIEKLVKAIPKGCLLFSLLNFLVYICVHIKDVDKNYRLLKRFR